jgi:transcriptional regulator with XRE-family HTH domain
MESAATLVTNLRASAALSQRALALRAGCTRSTIVRIENGEMDPTITMLARITAATGHSLNVRADRRLPKASLAAIAERLQITESDEIPYTVLRGLLDQLELHPESADVAITDPPPRVERQIDNLLAAIANKIADDNGMPRQTWASDVPIPPDPLQAPGTPRMKAAEAAQAPPQFVERRIFIAAHNFWRSGV